MCAERLSQFMTLALVWATFDLARGTDATSPPEGFQERSSQQKGRLSLQNTGECVRPCGGELRGGDAGHPYGAPRAPRTELGAHLGPRELLGWRGMCKGEREARRGEVRAGLCARGIRTCRQGDETAGAGLVAVLPGVGGKRGRA